MEVGKYTAFYDVSGIVTLQGCSGAVRKDSKRALTSSAHRVRLDPDSDACLAHPIGTLGGEAQWLERRPLTGEISLIYT